MKLSTLLLPVASLSIGSAFAASWGFDDATLTVQSKGAGVGGGLKEKLSSASPLAKEVSLGPQDTLKIVLTTTEGSTPKRAHQAFLTLHDSKTGLEDSYLFSLKETGKGKVELSQKDLPFQFLTSESQVSANLVIGSFGSSTPYNSKAFTLNLVRDPASPVVAPEPPLRYGKKPEIHHIFKSDPKNPPRIISGFFTLVVVLTLPILCGVWMTLGANINHFGKAMSADPVSHALFFGSIAAMEGLFFLYYTHWNLFQVLPVAIVLGAVMVVSGSRALTEVQERRLAGQR